MKVAQCRVLHRWTRVSVCSIHTYQECAHCGARRVREALAEAGYEPVDSHWLQTGQWRQASATFGIASNGASAQPVALNITFNPPASQGKAEPRLPNRQPQPALRAQTS